MKKEVLFELKSLYRNPMQVIGYRFGSGEKSCAVVAGMRGNEIHQIYTAGQLVNTLKRLEKEGRLEPDKSILVIPCVNPYSANIEKRFWPVDNTDINRMMPGYNLGETTQRVAAGVFEAVQGYRFGIHMTSNYIPGLFVPHVRMMKTGWEDVEAAKSFGLPYVSLRQPKPYDTTTLNYNWQVWETKAFSMFSNQHTGIDREASESAVASILNFLNNQGIIRYKAHKGYQSEVIEESSLISIKASVAGFFEPTVEVNQMVVKGTLLARIINPGDGSVRLNVCAPEDGRVFFMQANPMCYESAVLIRLLPMEE